MARLSGINAILEWGGRLRLDEILPLFDGGVRASREAAGGGALAEALLDRSNFLTEIGHYTDALADLEEVMALRSTGPNGI